MNVSCDGRLHYGIVLPPTYSDITRKRLRLFHFHEGMSLKRRWYETYRRDRKHFVLTEGRHFTVKRCSRKSYKVEMNDDVNHSRGFFFNSITYRKVCIRRVPPIPIACSSEHKKNLPECCSASFSDFSCPTQRLNCVFASCQRKV